MYAEKTSNPLLHFVVYTETHLSTFKKLISRYHNTVE